MPPVPRVASSPPRPSRRGALCSLTPRATTRPLHPPVASQPEAIPAASLRPGRRGPRATPDHIAPASARPSCPASRHARSIKGATGAFPAAAATALLGSASTDALERGETCIRKIPIASPLASERAQPLQRSGRPCGSHERGARALIRESCALRCSGGLVHARRCPRCWPPATREKTTSASRDAANPAPTPPSPCLTARGAHPPKQLPGSLPASDLGDRERLLSDRLAGQHGEKLSRESLRHSLLAVTRETARMALGFGRPLSGKDLCAATRRHHACGVPACHTSRLRVPRARPRPILQEVSVLARP